MAKKKIYFFPKTNMGKKSFWFALFGLFLMYVQYWTAMAFSISIPILLGIIPMILMILFGITSMIAIFKHKDLAISLFISSLIGILGIISVIGELFLPH